MTTNEIKQAFTMRDVIEKYGFRPNRAGFISCPFHKGDNTPSMKIYKDSFYCFACQKSGDIFAFVMSMENVDFKQAFRILGGNYEHNFSARRKLYQIQKEKERQKKQLAYIDDVLWANRTLITFYRKRYNECEPFSDAWCNAYNKLQYQLYLNEILTKDLRKSIQELDYETVKRIGQREYSSG